MNQAAAEPKVSAGQRIAGWFQRFWVDALLLALSITFFGLFLHNSLVMGTASLGYRTRVGNLKVGTINRKSVDAPAFSEVKPEAPLYDRDAIWTPPNEGMVQIRLIDETLFDVSPGSLVVLKKQDNLKAPGLLVDIVSGSVEIREISHQVAEGFTQFRVGDKPMPASDITKGAKLGKDAKEAKNAAGKPKDPPNGGGGPSPTPVPAPSPSAAPSTAPSAAPSAAPGGSNPGNQAGDDAFHPREGMKYYSMSKAAIELTFSWPAGISGELVVRPEGNPNKATEVRVKNTQPSGTKATIRVGAGFEWSVQDSSGKAVFGPHHFVLSPYSGAQMLDTMGSGDQGMVEILQ